ncbi:ATP phosphoribosyltransferase [Halosquirtibacter xylanolyticus]|uniref:ATP phosphoribosyltransferase n=1 Tax=Halosquirtibacter xylanolyticus TaxID=3374599 RepID=UPI003748C31C|nr:ATP phosphoribosyltransferase [Prolixibacteraceae bacterium]
MKTLRIAIQTKGRLNQDSIDLLADIGIQLTQGKRKLISKATNFPVEVLFLRDDDIPKTVADGIADIGIVGENEVLEKRESVNIAKRLGFSKCRLSLAIPKTESYTGPQWFNNKTIATSYPRVLEQFLDENNVTASIHEISGSVEVAPSIGLADAIFDIVSSGSTLISNNLKEIEIVTKSEALLITNRELTNEKLYILQDILFRLDTVETAKGKKYIMLNAPNERLEEIKSLLPGMKSPTIIPLANAGWSSLHSVIDEPQFWSIIKELKDLGAESILMLPIEKMIL